MYGVKCQTFDFEPDGPDGKPTGKVEKLPHCEGADAQSVIKYRITRTGYTRIFTLGIFVGCVVGFLVTFFAAVIYYRGFIYIVCGPRKPATAV